VAPRHNRRRFNLLAGPLGLGWRTGSNAMNAITKTETEILEIPAPQQGGALAESSPAGMMMAMMGKGASLEQIEKMMELVERHDKREAEKAYNCAFSAFKAEALRVIKNRAVTAGPLSGKSYAELFSVVDAVTPALSRNGLSTAWKLTKDDKEWIEVTCTMKHAAGHSESVSMGGPPDAGGAKSSIQARASTVSYLQRYTLKAITGVAEGGEDNDGANDAPSVDDWVSWARNAPNLDTLDVVFKDGAAAFQQLRDTKGYGLFMAAGKKRSAELKATI
jgi:hypothetical protein